MKKHLPWVIVALILLALWVRHRDPEMSGFLKGVEATLGVLACAGTLCWAYRETLMPLADAVRKEIARVRSDRKEEIERLKEPEPNHRPIRKEVRHDA